MAMASFKKAHEMLCLCPIVEIIDKEEFDLLYEAYRPSNLPFPHSAYEKFSFPNKDPAECKGRGKRGHIVADTLLPMLFLGCANWETFVADTKCF